MELEARELLEPGVLFTVDAPATEIFWVVGVGAE